MSKFKKPIKPVKPVKVKLTIAERVAKVWVDDLFYDLISPGAYAGPELNKLTWNPWGLISANLFLSYRSGKVSKIHKEKARLVVEREWKKKLEEWQKNENSSKI